VREPLALDQDSSLFENSITMMARGPTPLGPSRTGPRSGDASDPIVMLHEATAGAMRDLDRLATGTLRETARKKRKLVERDVVIRVIEAETRERDR
jgi:hypothetical protein